MTYVDDRIVLPLSKVRALTERWCTWHCRVQNGAHSQLCLVPEVEERDALMAKQYEHLGISPDCQDKAKHGACTGCICDCHRHSRRPA